MTNIHLFAIVTAAWSCTVLGRGELFKSCSQDAVQLLMLSPVSDHLVCVCAVVVTFQTMKMTRTLLIGA